MRQWLQQHWRRRQPAGLHPLDLLLLPLSWLYGAVSAARRALYRRGRLPETRLPVPVVVVGNVVVGGAGKTPVTIALALALQAHGWQVGIISRGYGRKDRDCREVQAHSSAAQVGDEPLLIARRTSRPVFVAASRVQAGQALLRRHPEVNVLLCDDGLQHLALARDFELCVMPGWGTGNGRLLPAGPLRQPWPCPVDALLVSHAPGHLPAGCATAAQPGRAAAAAMPQMPLWQALRSLGKVVRNGHGQTRDLHSFTDPVLAVAGIAQPQAFFDMLAENGIRTLQTIALPDHHDFGQLPPQLQALPAHCALLCTEKDAVKLWPLCPHAWAVALELELPAALLDQIELRLRSTGGACRQIP